MMKKLLLKFIFLLLLLDQPAYAANTADADAKSVNLEITCATGQNNCFDNLNDLQTWVKTTRKPDSSSQLTVRISNGTFSATSSTAFNCDSDFTGYIHMIGEGASNSIIQIGQPGDFASFYNVSGCQKMEFSFLSFNTASNYGYVTWSKGGSSRWNNVEISGKGAAWIDGTCGATEGTHYWYSSKLTSQQSLTAARSYQASCDKTWLFGSEVTSIVQEGGDVSGNNAGYNNAVVAQGNANNSNIPEIHLYGSNIRAISYGTVTNPSYYIRGTVHADNGGEVHIHGTGIDSISESGQDIIVMSVESGGTIHANESAYVIKTTGNATRIINSGGTIKAPYVWEPKTSAPAITSVDGADTFVDTSGTTPTMYIYASGCSFAGGPWISTAGQCRQ